MNILMEKALVTNGSPYSPQSATIHQVISSRQILDDLERRITALPTPNERGAAFEVFSESYLFYHAQDAEERAAKYFHQETVELMNDVPEKERLTRIVAADMP